MNKKRDATKEGYAWAESGRSEYDVMAVIDWCTLKIPYDITPEFLAHEDAVWKVRQSELARLEVVEDDQITCSQGQADRTLRQAPTAGRRQTRRALGHAAARPRAPDPTDG
jgi:hypothetical protein